MIQNFIDYVKLHWPLIFLFYAGKVSGWADSLMERCVAVIFILLIFSFVTRTYTRVSRHEVDNT